MYAKAFRNIQTSVYRPVVKPSIQDKLPLHFSPGQDDILVWNVVSSFDKGKIDLALQVTVFPIFNKSVNKKSTEALISMCTCTITRVEPYRHVLASLQSFHRSDVSNCTIHLPYIMKSTIASTRTFHKLSIGFMPVVYMYP